MLYYSGNITYNDALIMINKLEANGIEANITAGGIRILCAKEKTDTMKSILKQYNAPLTTKHPSM